MISKSPLKNVKRMAKYYTFDGFSNGLAQNAFAGNNLKCARGVKSVLAHNKSFVFIKGVGEIVYAFGENKVLYYSYGTDGGILQNYAGTFSQTPNVVTVYDGKNFIPVFTGEEAVYYHKQGVGGELKIAEDVEKFDIGCYAYERLWTYKDGKLRFSAPLNFSDFTVGKNGGGEIEVPDIFGKVIALIAYENRVYIFRENGIQRLDSRGEQAEFIITDCAALMENIKAETIAVGNECMYFCTDSSIYKLAVTKVSKVYSTVFEKYNLQPISATYGCGKYVLSASGVNGDALYHLDDSGVEVISIKADCLTSIVRSGKVIPLFLYEGKAYTIDNENFMPLKWESDFLDLKQGAREKILERVKAHGYGDFTLTVKSGKVERKLKLHFKEGVADIPVGMRGDYFKFQLESVNGGYINGLSVLYTLSKGGKL